MHLQQKAEWFAWIVIIGMLLLIGAVARTLRWWFDRFSPMHPQQKAAWLTLIVISGAVVLYVVLVPTLSLAFHRTPAEAALPCLGVFGLVGLVGSVAPSGGPFGKTTKMDERDRLLTAKAWSTGMGTFWGVFVLASLGSWAYLFFVRGLSSVTVPVALFPGIVFACGVVFLFVWSLATLHYYGWRASDASSQ